MSKFAGIWHYASQTAEGDPVVRNKEAITIADDEKDGTPKTVKIKLSDQTCPELPVDGDKTELDISFTRKAEEGEATLRGRLVILSATTPAILIGAIHQPRPPASGGKPQGQVEDHNTDVFIAVKIG